MQPDFTLRMTFQDRQKHRRNCPYWQEPCQEICPPAKKKPRIYGAKGLYGPTVTTIFADHLPTNVLRTPLLLCQNVS